MAEWKTCPVCEGNGQIEKDADLIKIEYKGCPKCYGTGKIASDEMQLKKVL